VFLRSTSLAFAILQNFGEIHASVLVFARLEFAIKKQDSVLVLPEIAENVAKIHVIVTRDYATRGLVLVFALLDGSEKIAADCGRVVKALPPLLV